MASQQASSRGQLPEGVFSILDTDLYKLTMQCCVLKYFPETQVQYNLTNRTPDMRLNRLAYQWLQKQINNLENVQLSEDELAFLKSKCPYLTPQYLRYLQTFRFRPAEQIELSFHATTGGKDNDEVGDIELHTKGSWLETILYEIPLLALVSEAYFKFIDRDWNHDGQREKAIDKGRQLLENGCIFSEFGSRRRRDYHTQELVIHGLKDAQDEATKQGWKGKLSGTSNVHFAMKFGIPPVGTVAHEWFMGIAAATDNYEDANEIALNYWVATFGEGVLGIALTDTFGTFAFLEAFKKPMPDFTAAEQGSTATKPSVAAGTTISATDTLSGTEPPIHAPITNGEKSKSSSKTYAQAFAGVRQDSGDPETFISTIRKFYDEQGIKDKKTIVFSDSLNIDLCLKYKKASEAQGFQPTFGVGTFLTNDYTRLSTGKKSVPMNIVIKIASVAGHSAIKISDNIGKNTGDKEKVAEVKKRLGYEEKTWAGGDESTRWGKEGDVARKP